MASKTKLTQFRRRYLSESEISVIQSPIPCRLGEVYRNIADTYFNEPTRENVPHHKSLELVFSGSGRNIMKMLYMFYVLKEYT
ncbi:Hypothetical predicted protein, partial [Mytilus galloprovincialis]|uniref:Uncharacterized protein n=1 Tax=Mytilus galloprovincialis TaxID=29158 RepID=A0A8B6GE76_MYTGA